MMPPAASPHPAATTPVVPLTAFAASPLATDAAAIAVCRITPEETLLHPIATILARPLTALAGNLLVTHAAEIPASRIIRAGITLHPIAATLASTTAPVGNLHATLAVVAAVCRMTMAALTPRLTATMPVPIPTAPAVNPLVTNAAEPIASRTTPAEIMTPTTATIYARALVGRRLASDAMATIVSKMIPAVLSQRLIVTTHVALLRHAGRWEKIAAPFLMVAAGP